MDKPKSNHLISVKCPHRLTQEVQRRSPTEDGPIQGDWWCSRTSHPYLVCSGPNFVGCLLLPLQRWCHVYSRGIVWRNGGLLKIGRHARKHNSTPSPPFILWWFDPRAEVKRHMDCWHGVLRGLHSSSQHINTPSLPLIWQHNKEQEQHHIWE